eukprot:2074088-Rhodomonas_salina.2
MKLSLLSASPSCTSWSRHTLRQLGLRGAGAEAERERHQAERGDAEARRRALGSLPEEERRSVGQGQQLARRLDDRVAGDKVGTPHAVSSAHRTARRQRIADHARCKSVGPPADGGAGSARGPRASVDRVPALLLHPAPDPLSGLFSHLSPTLLLLKAPQRPPFSSSSFSSGHRIPHMSAPAHTSGPAPSPASPSWTWWSHGLGQHRAHP